MSRLQKMIEEERLQCMGHDATAAELLFLRCLVDNYKSKSGTAGESARNAYDKRRKAAEFKAEIEMKRMKND